MKKRIIALVAVMTLLMAFFAGCGGAGVTTPDNNEETPVNEAQLVVAMNPILVLNGTDTIVAYNDLTKAMTADSQGSSLAALSQSGWQWRSQKESGSWMQRATYNWGKWTSGSGAQTKGLFAYAFNEAGNQSVGVYTSKNAKLVPYGQEQADAVGILVSVTGAQEEALTYVVSESGELIIPESKLTAISEVNGVKTGFLAEDGTARSASVRLVINETQVFSGTLANSTAAADGNAVTQLTIPQLEGLQVKEGDIVSFCFKLDAQANVDKDVTIPQEGDEDGWVVTKKSELVKVELTEDEKDSLAVTDDGSIRMIRNLEFTFKLVRDPDDAYLGPRIARVRTDLELNMDAEVFVQKSGATDAYEVVFGACPERPRSVELTKELINYRADNLRDWRVVLEGTKLYVVGTNNDALELAIQHFMTMFGSSDKAVVPAKYDKLNRPKHFPLFIAGQNVGSYVIRTERYPSTITRLAAEGLRDYVINSCGFDLEIRPMNIKGTDHVPNEIRVGPCNGSVKVHRKYDTKFTNKTEKTVGKFSIDVDGFPTDMEDGEYKTYFEGKNLIIMGGSDYAVSAAMAKLMATFTKEKKLDASYKNSGVYKSQFDYFGLVEDVEGIESGRETLDYSLVGGYALALEDGFDYVGSDADNEASVRSRWAVNTDESAGCISAEERQFRPGIYGENWWITQDEQGNGYLMEVTKRAYRVSTNNSSKGKDYIWPGYDAVRLASAGKFAWRFGISETRLVIGCRNGTCSAVWYASGSPISTPGYSNEFDLYENYGREELCPNSYANHPDHTTMASQHGQNKVGVVPNDGEHFYDTFHTVTMDWNYDRFYYRLDGEIYCTVTMDDVNKFRPLRMATTWKLANGIGAGGYTSITNQLVGGGQTHNPADWMNAAYTAKYGTTVEDFFELQVVDYIRLYQTDNAGKTSAQANQLGIVRSYNSFNRPATN